MVKGDQSSMDMSFWAKLFKAGLRQHRVSAKFEFRFESLKGISVLVLFVYKLMIGSFKNSTENYPRKCFWTQEKKTQVKFNPGLSANRPSNNWALEAQDMKKCSQIITWTLSLITKLHP